MKNDLIGLFTNMVTRGVIWDMKPIEQIRAENFALAIDEQCGGSQTVAADKLGYSTPSLVSRMANGKKSIGTQGARKIESVLGLPQFWMDSDHSAAAASSEAQQSFDIPTFSDSFTPVPVPSSGWIAIPVMGHAQLGDNGHFSEMQVQEGGDGYIDFPSRDPGVYAVKCVGDSMRPRIQAGEFAVIEPHHPYEPGDDVLAFATDGRVMIKRFLYKRDGSTHLVSINDAHPPIILANDEIEKIHFVRAICRPSVWRETP